MMYALCNKAFCTGRAATPWLVVKEYVCRRDVTSARLHNFSCKAIDSVNDQGRYLPTCSTSRSLLQLLGLCRAGVKKFV